MKSLPIIDAPVFQEQDLRTCSNGSCCQCGMCCIAFRIDAVQSIPGDARSPKIRKEMGVPCPQLIWKDGKYACLLHDSPKRPRVCQEWSGKEERGHHVQADYKDLAAASMLLFPAGKTMMINAAALLSQGAFTEQTIDIAQKQTRRETMRVLRTHLVTCEHFEPSIFTAIDIRNAMLGILLTKEDVAKTLPLDSQKKYVTDFLHFFQYGNDGMKLCVS